MTGNLWSLPPWYYFVVAALFVAFHAVRGNIGQKWLNKANPLNPNYEAPKSGAKKMSDCQARWVFYLHDALLHTCCTAFGFACLLFVYRLAPHGASELSGLAFLAFLGLVGITGQLAAALASLKFPSWS